MRLQFVPVSGSKLTVMVAAGKSAEEPRPAVSLRIFPVHEGMTQLVVPLASVWSAAAIRAPSRAAFCAICPV
jgi:hypothetical protein